MKKSRVNDVIVGLVVIVAIVTLLGATLWVREADVGERRARVVARFRDVGSVRVGSQVVIRGVPAGRVEAVELADGGWVLVRLRLAEDVELPPDPAVMLNTSSLFGDWHATILSRNALPDQPAVRRQVAEASGEPGVLPGAMLPDIAQLTGVAGGIADDVASVAERVRVAFTDTAAAELRASIANVADLSTELARTVRVQSRNLDRVAVDVHGGVSELRRTAQAFRQVAGRLDSATSAGEVSAIVADLSTAARQVEMASARVNGMAARLDTTQARLDRVLARSDSIAEKVNGGRGSLGLLLNDPSLYHRSDSAMMALRSLLADVQANPKRYIRLKIF